MKAYPDNFKSADAPFNDIEDVYNGPDPDIDVDPRVTEGVYDGPGTEPCECVYAGPEYFEKLGKSSSGNSGRTGIGRKIAEGASRVKDAAGKIKK